MCFGEKDLSNNEVPRPAQFPPPQPTYAAAVPGSQSQAGQQQPQVVAELPAEDKSAAAYDPPAGPPPSSSHQPGGSSADHSSLPSKETEKVVVPRQHDWQSAVPDTALFPPPPPFYSGWDRSPANNATEAEAAQGQAWCASHPLAPPQPPSPAALEMLAHHAVRPMAPASGFHGEVRELRPGVWAGHTTDKHAPDATVIGYPPLYSVAAHSPAVTGRPHTIYYEARVLPPHAGAKASKDEEVSLALGFAALPYPPFRLPGWHRGSLAVHGDDGHRYVNDVWGGRTFTDPMRVGETYGVGMTLRPRSGKGLEGQAATGRPARPPIEVEVFFTRHGREVGRWNLHEEVDAKVNANMPVTGLEGLHDLSAAVGSFDLVRFEVVFDPEMWLYKRAKE